MLAEARPTTAALPDLSIGQIDKFAAHVQVAAKKISTGQAGAGGCRRRRGEVDNLSATLSVTTPRQGLSPRARLDGLVADRAGQVVPHAMQLIESGKSPSQVARTLKVAGGCDILGAGAATVKTIKINAQQTSC